MPNFYLYHPALDWRAAKLDFGNGIEGWLRQHTQSGTWGIEIIDDSPVDDQPSYFYRQTQKSLDGLLLESTDSDHALFYKRESGPCEGKRSLIYCSIASFDLPHLIAPVAELFPQFQVLDIEAQSSFSKDLHLAADVKDILYRWCIPELKKKSFEPPEFKADCHPIGPAKKTKAGRRKRSPWRFIVIFYGLAALITAAVFYFYWN